MKNLHKKSIIFLVSSAVIGLLVGWIIFGRPDNRTPNNEPHPAEAKATETVWTCSMHPQIRQPEPGDCPICGMDLIPLEAGQGALDPMAVSMSPTAMQLAQVETLVVGKGNAEKSIRLNGKIQADERRIETQSSHVPGRIEKLMVNFTGDYVQQGQVIAYIYSPDLVTAQQELLEAAKIKEMQPALFNSAKEKLKNWKLTENQIGKVLASNKPVEQFPVLANISGYVTRKMVNAGDYVMRGEAIYQIADLSKVWVLFDVYESDMGLIRKGASVSYTVSALPGSVFEGIISYVDPVIDPMTRIARARLEVVNKGLAFKPEMFVSGTVKSEVRSGSAAITVPKTAVMWTGKRSVVYVMNNTEQGVGFTMRTVELGPELGESYVITSGLETGEEIAVHGTFAIDAAAQLAGKPSMMSPEEGAAAPAKKAAKPTVTISAGAKKALTPVFDRYFEMKTALANDDLGKARKAGADLKAALDKVSMSLFEGQAHDIWMKQSAGLKQSIQHLEHAGDMDKFRGEFIKVSGAIITMAESLGTSRGKGYVQHCPMADSNKGADWLNPDSTVTNPYFGRSMSKCGATRKVLE